jgi:hypothetical protein
MENPCFFFGNIVTKLVVTSPNNANKSALKITKPMGGFYGSIRKFRITNYTKVLRKLFLFFSGGWRFFSSAGAEVELSPAPLRIS